MTKEYWKHFKICPKKSSIPDNTVYYWSFCWQFSKFRESVDKKITHISEHVFQSKALKDNFFWLQIPVSSSLSSLTLSAQENLLSFLDPHYQSTIFFFPGRLPPTSLTTFSHYLLLAVSFQTRNEGNPHACLFGLFFFIFKQYCLFN